MTGRPRKSPRGEDLAFMAETGETPSRAAARLDTTVDALEKWCRTNGHHHTWTQLVANAHRPGHGARVGSITKAIA